MIIFSPSNSIDTSRFSYVIPISLIHDVGIVIRFVIPFLLAVPPDLLNVTFAVFFFIIAISLLSLTLLRLR